MLTDAIQSICNFSFYRKASQKSIGATVGYIAFLGLVYALAMLIAIYVHIRPLIGQAVEWTMSSVPVLTLADGKLSSSRPGKTEVRHPKYPQLLIIIDTDRTTAVTSAEMVERGAQGYLTQDTIHIFNPQSRKLESYDLSQAKNPQPIVMDGEFYRKIAGIFSAVLYPSTFAISWIFFFVLVHFWALVYSVVALLINAFAGGKMEYPALYKISVYAQTPVVVLQIASLLIWKPIPFYRLLALLVVGVYLWQAIQQNMAPPHEAPPAA